MIRENGWPFRLMADKFYSRKNMAYLKKAAAEMASGKRVHAQELIED